MTRSIRATHEESHEDGSTDLFILCPQMEAVNYSPGKSTPTRWEMQGPILMPREAFPLGTAGCQLGPAVRGPGGDTAPWDGRAVPTRASPHLK